MQPRTSQRRDASLALVLLVVLAVAAALVWAIPRVVSGLSRVGVVVMPPYAPLAMQISNWVTARWYLVIGPPVALVGVLILSWLIKR
jgi:hypothetical protein